MAVSTILLTPSPNAPCQKEGQKEDKKRHGLTASHHGPFAWASRAASIQHGIHLEDVLRKTGERQK